MLRKIFPRLRPLFGGVLLMVLVLSGGCASGPKWDDAQRNILEQRVRDRFQALVARDFEKVWEYRLQVIELYSLSSCMQKSFLMR